MASPKSLFGPIISRHAPVTERAARQGFVETPAVLSRRETVASDPRRSDLRERDDYNLYVPTEPFKARSRTQAEQNVVDEEARKKVMKELIQSWMDRLQLISVITTFFAAIEGQLLDIVSPGDPKPLSRIRETAAATLSSALIVHIFAAILSFTAAFFLVRFRLHEASRQEHKIEHQLENGSAPRPSTDSKAHTASPPSPPSPPLQPAIFSADPRLEQVGPFRRGQPPTHLLENCHTLCMVLAVVGFVLALAGALCYVWAMLPLSSSILASAFLGLCLTAAVGAIFLPQGYSLLLGPIQVTDNSTY